MHQACQLKQREAARLFDLHKTEYAPIWRKKQENLCNSADGKHGPLYSELKRKFTSHFGQKEWSRDKQ